MDRRKIYRVAIAAVFGLVFLYIILEHRVIREYLKLFSISLLRYSCRKPAAFSVVRLSVTSQYCIKTTISLVCMKFAEYVV